MPEVRISIGVSLLSAWKSAFEIDKSPADHELTILSPDIFKFEIVNPVASIDTIAFVAWPVIESMSPVTPEARLTPLPTPLVKVRPSMSAVPPVKETPVPTSVNSLTVKMRSPLDRTPPLKSVNEASEISALPLTPVSYTHLTLPTILRV